VFYLRHSSDWNPHRLHSEPFPPKENHNVGLLRFDDDHDHICYRFAQVQIFGGKSNVFKSLHFPRWQNILSWVYRATFILMPLILSTPCYALIYTTSHLRFQFYMLLHFLKRINSGYETSDVNQLIDNRQFQKEVKKRLKFCLKRHAHLFA
jgi:hypothetical protein